MTANNKPSKTITILVWIAIILTIIGEFFKVNHWPGASVLLVFGSFILALFYLPLYTIENWKQRETWKSKVSFIFQTAILFLFSIGFIFKIQHWPLSGIFYVINNILLLILVLPFALYHIYKASKNNSARTHTIFLSIYFFCLSLGSLMNAGTGKINIDSVLMQGINTEEALRTATSRNKQLYATLNNIKIEHNSIINTKVNRLKTITDSAINHITNLQSYLLVANENISKAQADTLSSADIRNTNNSDIPTHILIGNEFKPNKDIYSALKLKSAINSYRDSLLNLVQEQNRAIIKEGLNLNTNSYDGPDGEPISWEISNFNSMPFLYVFNTLTNIKYEIKNAEYQVLTDIINSDNKDLNTALFSQIANLNSKYDAIRKQEEITKLKSENEKKMALLNDKASELNDTKQTIIYFVLITISFSVLIFFALRSNYLRKKANKILSEQKQIIELQKEIVEEKQREILDSIEYALRIQTAILPPTRIVKQYLENSFILYKPKDIVAGDFYWMETVGITDSKLQIANSATQSEISNPKSEIILFAACDCTGHGVPGAMVSVVCHNALNRAVREYGLTQPASILDKTAEIVIDNFSKSEESIKDGMDISLCSLTPALSKGEGAGTYTLQWAGANNPLWIVRNTPSSLDTRPSSLLEETKADKQPIGMNEDSKPFTNHTFTLNSGDTIYLFTDGFADQFGGETGEKKLTRKRFKDLLLSIQHLSMPEQGIALDKFIVEYRKEVEQIDDILVMGVRV